MVAVTAGVIPDGEALVAILDTVLAASADWELSPVLAMAADMVAMAAELVATVAVMVASVHTVVATVALATEALEDMVGMDQAVGGVAL